MGLKYWSWMVCGLTVLNGSIPVRAQVTNLEAVHVAEMALNRAATEWKHETLNGVDHIVVTVPDKPAVKQVWVHAGHGRISQIVKEVDGKSDLIYRWPGVKVVAHRGGARLGPPENTLAAFEKAIEIGADLVEIDVRETQDGHLIIMHDDSVDRTTNGSGSVNQLTLDEIRALDAGIWAGEQYKGLKVPTLKEALELMKGRIQPDLDFKIGNLEKLVAVVNELGIADQCTHCGPWERCRKIKELQPKIRIRPTIDYVQQVPLMVNELHPPIVNMDWDAITEESIRLSHLAGCEAFINCLGRADTLPYAQYCIENGADYIQSDRPDLVIELLKSMGMHYDRSLEIKH